MNNIFKTDKKRYFVALVMKRSMQYLGANIPIQGAAGYLPVYETRKEAEKNYPGQIAVIEVKDNLS